MIMDDYYILLSIDWVYNMEIINYERSWVMDDCEWLWMIVMDDCGWS